MGELRKLALKYASSLKENEITPSLNNFTTVLCVHKLPQQVHSVQVRKSGQKQKDTHRGTLMEERMMETFILAILLLYILIGCWTEDMELVAGGATGCVLVLAFRR